MIDIAMLGCDSTHTEAYARLLNSVDSRLHGRARVRRIWGEDLLQAQEKASACGIDRVCDSPEEALRGCDMALVVGRYGESHSLPASVALRLGIPTFVDKPFTDDADAARALVRLAEATHTPLASCSPLRFAREIVEIRLAAAAMGPICGAVVSGPSGTPAIQDARATKLHFYSVHAVDLLCSILGVGIERVTATEGPNGVWANLRYDGKDAALNLPRGGREYYHVTIFGRDGCVASAIDPDGDFYERTLLAILSGLPTGAVSAAPIQEAYEGIWILDMLERSLRYKSEIRAEQQKL